MRTKQVLPENSHLLQELYGPDISPTITLQEYSYRFLVYLQRNMSSSYYLPLSQILFPKTYFRILLITFPDDYFDFKGFVFCFRGLSLIVFEKGMLFFCFNIWSKTTCSLFFFPIIKIASFKHYSLNCSLVILSVDLFQHYIKSLSTKTNPSIFMIISYPLMIWRLCRVLIKSYVYKY